MSGRRELSLKSVLGILVISAVGLVASPTAASATTVSPDQSAFAWGYNGNGGLGDATVESRSTPVSVDVAGGLAGKAVVSVVAGVLHSCALTTTNEIYCWGANSNGQLGNGSLDESLTPVAVDMTGALDGVQISSISAGGASTCALSTTGHAYCWGGNGNGSLGDGNMTDSPVPVAVDTTGVLADQFLTHISTGNTTCAVSREGKAFCWGDNSLGQLGNGTDWAGSPYPVAVDDTGVLSGVALTHVDTGFTVCGVGTNGKAYCWGMGAYGALGNGSKDDVRAPVAVKDDGALAGRSLTQVSVGYLSACAVDTQGSAFCWGIGNLGDGVVLEDFGASLALPVAVDMSQLPTGTKFKGITVGYLAACATTTTGGAYCWGYNSMGQLGNGSTSQDLTGESRPAAVTALPGSFNANRPITSVDMDGSGYHVVATVGYSARPGAPQGLQAATVDGQPTLTWLAPITSGAGPITQYWVFYRPAGQGAFKAHARGVSRSSLNLSTCSEATACPLLYGVLRTGSSYDFQVLAVNPSGHGRWSSSVTVAVP